MEAPHELEVLRAQFDMLQRGVITRADFDYFLQRASPCVQCHCGCAAAVGAFLTQPSQCRRKTHSDVRVSFERWVGDFLRRSPPPPMPVQPPVEWRPPPPMLAAPRVVMYPGLPPQPLMQAPPVELEPTAMCPMCVTLCAVSCRVDIG